jgi:phosphate transport system permease protein
MASDRGFWEHGTAFVWGTGSMVIMILLLLCGLLGIILYNGLAQFWPDRLYQVQTASGENILGYKAGTEVAGVQTPGSAARTRYKIGGRDVFGLDFRWLDDSAMSVTCPDSAVALERLTDGDLYGYLVGFRTENSVVTGPREDLWKSWQEACRAARADFERASKLEVEI